MCIVTHYSTTEIKCVTPAKNDFIDVEKPLDIIIQGKLLEES